MLVDIIFIDNMGGMQDAVRHLGISCSMKNAVSDLFKTLRKGRTSGDEE